MGEKGGNITRIIGGYSNRVARKSINLVATEEDLVLSSPKGVNLIGDEEGVLHQGYSWNDKEEEKDQTKTGGINTRFYDEQGQQVYEIPQKLHKAFNEEYGIKLAYDKEQEMLYYDGDCPPAYEKVSPTAIEHWKRELNPEQTSKGKLLFGYNFGYEAYSATKSANGNTYDKDGNLIQVYAKEPIFLGIVPGYKKITKVKTEYGMLNNEEKIIGNIACIDLGDFDDNLMVKHMHYKFPENDISYYKEFNISLPEFTCRYNGLTRVLEHEFIGHVLLKFTDDKYDILSYEFKTEGPTQVEAKLCNVIRKEIKIPDKITYGGGYALNSKYAGNVEMGFGYLNASDERYNSDVEYPYPPPKKYPKKQGEGLIIGEDYFKLTNINYIIKLRYDGQSETYDFS